MTAPAATPLPVGAGINLVGIWFNAAQDLDDVCAFERLGDSLPITSSVQVEIRQLATRRRLVRTGIKVYKSIPVALMHCSPTQRLWLEDHVGQLLCIRDLVGTKIYGAYTEAPVEISTLPRAGVFHSDVKVTLEQVDHSEAA